jgi:CP family cyanate transporter-like MFS transporter
MTVNHQEKFWTAVVLLWLAGVGLRITILAIPPVIPMIRVEFHLSATEVGLLSSIPSALFAVAAVVGSALVARLGMLRALVGGLLIVALGSALRGLSVNFPVLFATSILMAAGVAVMQPVMPTTVRQWLPGHIGLGTAIYTNGLLVGEVFPVWLTIPYVLPMVGSDWRNSLVVWSLPVAMTAVVVYLFAPSSPAHRPTPEGRVPQWRPDWTSGLVWRLGVLFGCVNSIYFGTNAFLPIYLTSQGRPDLIGGALTALNLGQVPASLLLLVLARNLERRAWPFILSGVLSLLSVVGLVFLVGPSTVVWAATLGFSDAAALILGLSLPPLLCHSEDIARTSAAMFTVSYSGAVAIAIISGVAWDLSGVPSLAFVPLGICAVTLAASTIALRKKAELR